MITGLKTFMIQWNNDHPLDRRFRDKHHISFNSQKHRSTNQLDLLSEYFETKMINEYEEGLEKQIKQEEEFKKGIWLSERIVTEQDTLDLFDKIDISSIGSDSQLQIED